MSTFKERAEAFEYEFAHDAEMRFRADMRRNRLLGMWAAGLLGRSGDEAVAYVRDLIRADLSEPGSGALLQKLVADLDGLADEAAIRAELSHRSEEAKSQLLGEGGASA